MVVFDVAELAIIARVEGSVAWYKFHNYSVCSWLDLSCGAYMGQQAIFLAVLTEPFCRFLVVEFW